MGVLWAKKVRLKNMLFLSSTLYKRPALASAEFPVAPRWRSPMWSAQAEAEGLTLLVADNKPGYFGVKQ